MDFIDKRDRKEKMAKSVIKRRNVVYTYPQEIGEKGQEEKQEKTEKALEILERLEQEQRADDEKWQQEIEQLLAEQEKNQMEINRIMNEKQEHLQKTMDEAAQSGKAETEQ